MQKTSEDFLLLILSQKSTNILRSLRKSITIQKCSAMKIYAYKSIGIDEKTIYFLIYTEQRQQSVTQAIHRNKECRFHRISWGNKSRV